ncbi:hypothetical protein GQ473_02720 [archaeon]|nr:hypothetical protein [archaeon]
MRIETMILKTETGISVVIYTKDGDKFVPSKVSAIFRSLKKEYIVLPNAVGDVVVYYASVGSNCVLPLGDGIFEVKYLGDDFLEINSVEVLAVSETDEIVTETFEI